MTVGNGPRGPILPYRIWRNFLSANMHRALLDWTLAHERHFRDAPLASGVIAPQVRNAKVMRDLGPVAAGLRAIIAEQISNWIAELRVTPFDITEIELELAAHNDGAHFMLHTDTYRTGLPARGDRMLSAVYYFHTEPKAFDGGILRLHPIGAQPGDLGGENVAPEQNSLVVFPSWTPHEVLRVSCLSGRFEDSRFAVNCWVYRARAA